MKKRIVLMVSLGAFAVDEDTEVVSAPVCHRRVLDGKTQWITLPAWKVEGQTLDEMAVLLKKEVDRVVDEAKKIEDEEK